ncbi:hypothetical protein LOZ65_000659 [Ophidiomyces ophidiicola]|nr:hypothetical protein LOZ65_000659 [Ophidiomyces ophidiicola]
MVPLSDDDIKIIKKHPFNHSLSRSRRQLQDVDWSYAMATSLDGTDKQKLQDAVSNLLIALIRTDAAFKLPSKISNLEVAAELFSLLQGVRKSDFNYIYYRPLVSLVIERRSDYQIWGGVFNLIARFSKVTTMSATTPPVADGTSIMNVSTSQEDSENSEDIPEGIEERVFEDIKGRTHIDVQGFYEKYFEGKDWTNRARDVYELVKDRHCAGKWLGLHDSPAQDDVQFWIFQVQNEFLLHERRRYYRINRSRELTTGNAPHHIDLIVKQRSGHPSDTTHDWNSVEVIGKLKASNKSFKRTLAQLARYAQDVFAYQPTRRYLHAFTICGTFMTPWVFDRSGCYSPGQLNIHEEPQRFISLIVGYLMMNEEELGLDTFIKRNGNHRFIHIHRDGAKVSRQLELKPDPLIHQQAIACRGMSCYLTKALHSKHWNYVTKFSWATDKRTPEVDLLKLANQRQVEGIATLVAHCAITSIKDLRSGLTFKEPYSFYGKSSTPFAVSQSQPHRHFSRPSIDPHDLAIAEIAGDRPSRKRKPGDVSIYPSKRQKPSRQRSGPLRNEISYDPNEETSSVLFGDNPYDNHILHCLVTHPTGRPIYKYQSTLELLEALRDAIKAHRNLYSQCNILHRDISENNIIITDYKKTGFAGMLIDMDLSLDLSNSRTLAPSRTGTVEFMAFGVLLNSWHTYRHDLESFFYVLIWQCGHRGWKFVNRPKDRPTDSLLSGWETGSFRKNAMSKIGIMDRIIFESVLEEFPLEFDCVKPLCRMLRGILFPICNGAMFTATPKHPETLYEPIIEAFTRAICYIKWGARGIASFL